MRRPTLFTFTLHVFSMKWSSRLGFFFVSLHFVLTRNLWTAPSAAAFVSAPLSSKRISRKFPLALPERHASFVLRSVAPQLQITFDIGYEHLLIKYMLKQYSRFRFHVCFRILVDFLFSFSLYWSSLSPPLHRSGLRNPKAPPGLFSVSSVPAAYIFAGWLLLGPEHGGGADGSFPTVSLSGRVMLTDTGGGERGERMRQNGAGAYLS